ncbi:MAG: peptidase U32 family protein [Promethearchaeota archaeon]
MSGEPASPSIPPTVIESLPLESLPKTKPELLVPLNGWKSLYPGSTVLQSADAVYFGLQTNFSMRARATNFPINDLDKLVEMVHSAEKRCYITTNIIIYNTELIELHQTLEMAKEAGVDAVICHDLASIMIAKEINLPFHISTQANITNNLSAGFYQELGASRLILARELQLDDIAKISAQCHIPIEVFVHGAQCSAVSGRCYLSAELMDHNSEFSANRGACVQPCRRTYRFLGEEGEELNYDGYSGMFFNAKDLCMIGHIPELIKAGIGSFKIEGRMRDPRYIEETAACYREAIDAVFDGTYSTQKVDSWLNRLSGVFNRGFHLGFFFGRPGPDDIQRTIRGNVAKAKKIQIGKVINYYGTAEAVEIELFRDGIRIRDELIFANQADFYHTEIVKSLQIEGEQVDETPFPTPTEHVLVGLKVSRAVPINSSVYRISTTQKE